LCHKVTSTYLTTQQKHHHVLVLFQDIPSAGWTLIGIASLEALPRLNCDHFSYLGSYTNQFFNIGLADNGYLSANNQGDWKGGFSSNDKMGLRAIFNEQAKTASVQFFKNKVPVAPAKELPLPEQVHIMYPAINLDTSGTKAHLLRMKYVERELPRGM